ncbi:MAG TPA: hypothetical protein PKD72_03810, partial [Gemmatales bacterium]|nr:hypothetical protein [Gemmatales bacterium]
MSCSTLPMELGDLAQAAAAYEEGYAQRLATFEYSLRVPPAFCNYLVFAGLEPLLQSLQQFRFPSELLDYLKQHPAFAGISFRWFDHLADLKFQGDVWALLEGSVFFAPAPILRITAPLEWGLLLATAVPAFLSLPTRVATRVARFVTACEGRPLIEQTLRQAHTQEEANNITRAAYLAGITSTTNLAAAERWKLPATSYMTDTWTMLLPDEVEAFHRYGSHFPTTCIAVIDTVDPLTGLMHAIASGAPLQAIRLEHGDLLSLSIQARKLLDDNGRRHVKLLASGDLNEEQIAKLIQQRAPVDGYIAGRGITTWEENPWEDVYKLVAVQEKPGIWEPACKLTTGKLSYPWPKQVYRLASDDGTFAQDVIAWEREVLVGEKLLQQVMHQGKRAAPLPT